MVVFSTSGDRESGDLALVWTVRTWPLLLLFLTGCKTWEDKPAEMHCVSDMQECRSACVWVHDGLHVEYWHFSRKECQP